MESLLRSIPRWLVAFAVVAFMLLFVERTYISQKPFRLFGQDFGPVTVSESINIQPRGGQREEVQAQIEKLQAELNSLVHYAKKTDLAEISDDLTQLRSEISTIRQTLIAMSQDYQEVVGQVRSLKPSPEEKGIQKALTLNERSLRGKKIELYYYNNKAKEALKMKNILQQLGANVAHFDILDNSRWRGMNRNGVYYADGTDLEAALKVLELFPDQLFGSEKSDKIVEADLVIFLGTGT